MALSMKVKIKLTIGWVTLLGNFILNFITKLVHYLFDVVQRHHYARRPQVEPLVQEPEQATDVEHAINPRTRMVIGTIGATMMNSSTSLLVFDYKLRGLKPTGTTIHSSTSYTDDSDDADDSAKNDTDSELDSNNKHGPEKNSSETPEERYEVAAIEQVTIPKPKNESKKKKPKRSKQKTKKCSTPPQMKRGKPSSIAKQQGSHGGTNHAKCTMTLDGCTMQRLHHPVKRPYNKQSTATADQDS